MTSRSERVVNVLNETDPQFTALCDLLYGPGVDAAAIWADVYGNEPIAKLSERGRHVAETVGLGATLVGGGLGVKELAEQAGKIGRKGNIIARGAHNMGKLVPAAIADNPKARTIIAGSMLAGDTAASTALASSGAQRRAAAQKQQVNKTLVSEAEQAVTRGRRAAAGAARVARLADQPSGGPNTLAVRLDRARAARPKPVGSLVPTKTTSPGPSGIINEAQKLADGQVQGANNAEKIAAKLVRGRARPLHTMAETPGKITDAVKQNPAKSALVGGGLLGGAAVVHDLRKPKMQDDGDVLKRLQAPTDEFEAAGTFSKFDDDKRLAFGWASVVSKNGVPVIDRQGDYMTIDDVEDAAYRYVISSRIGGDMHKRNGEQPHHVSDLVESMVFTKEKIAKMGLPKDFPEAWWVGFKVHDDDTWNLVKSDKRSGFSIHGRGKRALHEMDDAMGYS